MAETYIIGPVSSPLRGEVSVPGDKSISHRTVILGALAEGETVVRGFLHGADNRATINAFRAMGVEIEERSDETLLVQGRGRGGLLEPADVINAMNSGTTARLLTGLLAGQGFFSVITGDQSLRGRPMGRVVRPLREMGAEIGGRKGATLLPLAIGPAKLRGITYKTPVASAQLKSAILLAGLYAEGRTMVKEPALSRDHTERMLRAMGAEIKVKGCTVSIEGGSTLHGLDIDVPGDISSAAFFMVAALIVPGSEILIRNVGINPTRTGIIDILKKMGGDIQVGNKRGEGLEPTADILIRASALKGVEIDGEALLPAIDEFPIICVAAAFAEGVTKIRGAGELRVKESDRVAVMAGVLSAMGVRCVEKPDGIEIDGAGFGRLSGGQFETHGDHRVAMSIAVAALGAGGETAIKQASSVDVSYPGFFSDLETVREEGRFKRN